MDKLETRDAAYYVMMQADDIWHDAIVDEYGERLASRYRYTSEGVSTPKLKALHDKYTASREAYIDAQADYIKADHYAQA